MKKIRYNLPVAMGIVILFASACTDLEETFEDRLTLEQVEAATAGENPDVDGLLTEVYNSLLDIHGVGQEIIGEHTGDLLIAPTRGGDWDDNGAWRALHQHKWNADHTTIKAWFERLSSGMFAAIDLLQFNPNTQQEAEARFLRAFYVFWLCDGWGQVPIREPGAPLADIPDVLSGGEAINFVISELESIAGNLPSLASTDPWMATEDAAYALLAKAYINKAVYSSDDRQTFSFESADMDKVISNCDMVINSGNFELEEEYFANFTSDNGENSSELIFCSNNEAGIQSNNMRGTWMSGLHYNQTPSGWNGFTTLADFYNTFDEGDRRRGGELDPLTSETGLTAGFLTGQQYDKDGNPLEDRQGNPLVFTAESPIMVTGAALETSGYRFMKYIPDMSAEDVPGNDFPFLRYSDILLTKAEALMRKGDNGGALTIVNELRTARGATELGSIDEAGMLEERGRELYYEGWRRTDLVRFGKFLDAWSQKQASDPTYLLYPFPVGQIVANPGLQQNPGY